MDFARPGAGLGRYRVIVVPQLYLLRDAAIDALVAYVRGGGTLVCGFFTGVADEDDRVRPGGMDHRLRELFGIRTVHEWWPLDADRTVECEGFRGTLWSEELEPDGGAETVSAYRGGELDGLPAVLRKGSAWYVSTLPEPPALRELLGRVTREAGVGPVLEGLPAGSRPYAGAGCCSCSTTGAPRWRWHCRGGTPTCSRAPRPTGAYGWTGTVPRC